MTLNVIGKAMLIALCAAIAAWLPVAIMMTTGLDSGLRAAMALSLLPLALLGSFAIGLPISLIAFLWTKNHVMTSVTTLFVMANLAGIVLILTSFVLLKEEGVYILGIPSFIAANTFAILGWLWIIRPLRRARLA